MCHHVNCINGRVCCLCTTCSLEYIGRRFLRWRGFTCYDAIDNDPWFAPKWNVEGHQLLCSAVSQARACLRSFPNHDLFVVFNDAGRIIIIGLLLNCVMDWKESPVAKFNEVL